MRKSLSAIFERKILDLLTISIYGTVNFTTVKVKLFCYLLSVEIQVQITIKLELVTTTLKSNSHLIQSVSNLSRANVET